MAFLIVGQLSKMPPTIYLEGRAVMGRSRQRPYPTLGYEEKNREGGARNAHENHPFPSLPENYCCARRHAQAEGTHPSRPGGQAWQAPVLRLQIRKWRTADRRGRIHRDLPGPAG